MLQNNPFITNKFAQYLKKELGLSDFTKLVTFHEIGHHMDYTMRMDMLVARNPVTKVFEKMNLKDNIGEINYNNFLDYGVEKKV